MNSSFNFQEVFLYRDVLLKGLWLTIQLTLVSSVLGFLFGIVCALAKDSSVAAIRVLATAYIEVIRNTPFLVQLFFLFFGLSSLGLKLSETQAAILAMTVNLSAYAAEIIRAGIQSIHRGQFEAGLSLGMTRGQVFRHVILIPAVEAVYPALTSQFIIV
ncbi:MAG TPA: amino acid ABC transporter permease, partial [Opitutaceae bacterium]|nr:amino acid ABC transporter permease [Opitutaceae bacterium]